ncbi:MAG TPA: glycoside hydrolase family 2 TIM barrel-domain containing protein, partial [Chloroflexota bacterium]|nr:glycoside hydrolase family 2 TIM barrel-domain containing protein [Chloroflexota bacterium]
MIDLDGAWEFQHDPGGALTPAELGPMRPILVPSPWQAQFDDLRLVSGVGWYRRSFAVPPEWCDSVILLHFGAVDYFAEVWLNGHRIGEHEGGYLPFSFEVHEVARFDDANEIIVRVVDVGADTFNRFKETLLADIPHGKQNWYGPIGGIWQSVHLERRGPTYVWDLRLTPDLDDGAVEVAFLLGHPSSLLARIRIESPDGDEVASREILIDPESDSHRTTLSIQSPLVWDLASPQLYRCAIELVDGETVVDHTSETFGFRTIGTRDGSILLNGRPIYLRGALDQDYYPGTIYTPPSEDFLRDRFVKAKELGLNCLRCHIKAPDPRYYALADRLGLLIWTDLPSWGAQIAPNFGYGERSELATERALETMEGMIRRDWNHPSLICWSIVNEDWGTKLTTSAADRAWLRETYDQVKAWDPYRLVVDNSPCVPNFHLKSDLDDYHFYVAIPDHAEKWSALIEDFATRPAWSYSPHGDADRPGDEPLVVSEFGNWGLPNIHRLFDYYGGEPWWFATGEAWGSGRTRGLVHPRGVLERFAALGLETAFGSYENFVRSSQDGERAALAFEIEELRRHEAIKGYVITELTDVHWECNGLLYLCNGPKTFQKTLAAINADDVIISSLESGRRRSYWSGEELTVLLTASRYSRRDLDGAIVRWQLAPIDSTQPVSSDASWPAGQLADFRLKTAGITALGSISFVIPEVAAPTAARLRSELVDRSGTVVAESDLDLYLYPWSASRASSVRSIGIVGDGEPVGALATRLGAIGYRVSPDPPTADAIVSLRLDQPTIDLVRSGARVLIGIVNAIDAPTSIGSLEFVDRAGSGYEGDWASNFNWLNPL